MEKFNTISNHNSKFALTTIDNPFDPFEDFGEWYKFDMEKGYNSCAYLARIALLSDELSDEENNIEKERAIDEIVKNDFMKIYKKVVNKNYKTVGQ